MVPGEVAEVSFQLWPISALIRQGHRLRLAIAGADADTFDPIPAQGHATLTIHRNASNVSMLQLPVVEGGLGN
jgi:predicted acyl esterase